MAVLKCKMCGGELNLEPEATVCECEYCGSKQTVPVADNEKKMNLFSRANRLRFNNEFDKASGIYESIAAEFPEEAEAYWGLLLCKYGIEYVDDPVTGNKIPTCHRSSMESVLEDPDYELVMEYADSIAKRVYREQAKELEILRKNIVEISDQEDPYDIFICYKETDENGDRTLDSVLAQDVYDALTEKGYRVFFSRISLEDKLGQEYEPYIFAALHSAKIMLAFGTDPDYYDAVWVKNEWSRYLKLIASGEKKTLIPCFKGLDAYDMPKEFAKLQAQDMGKVGAIQDLIRGIDKVMNRTENVSGNVDSETLRAAIASAIMANSGSSAQAQVKRGNMALEDQDWNRAEDFFEAALNLDPECAEAYLGKLLVKHQQKNWALLVDYYKEKYSEPVAERLNAFPEDTDHIWKMLKDYVVTMYLERSAIRKLYDFDLHYNSCLTCRKNQRKKLLEELSSEIELERVKQYADSELRNQIDSGLLEIQNELDQRIKSAEQEDNLSINDLKERYTCFLEQTDLKVQKLSTEALQRKEAAYQHGIKLMNVKYYSAAIQQFAKLDHYKDCDQRITDCNELICKEKEFKENQLIYIDGIQLMNRQMYIDAVDKFRQISNHLDASEKMLQCQNLFQAELLAIAMSVQKKKIEIIEKDVKNLEDEKKSLGIFSGKQQKSIEQKIQQLVSQKEALYQELHMDRASQYNQNLSLADIQTIFQDQRILLLFSQKYKNQLKYFYHMTIIQPVGTVVSFGSFQESPIYWRVLEQTDSRVFLIAEYALLQLPYNRVKCDITWEKSSLRYWLNNDFVRNAFELPLQNLIENSFLKDSNCYDKVFLLSAKEVKKYLSTNASRQCYSLTYTDQNAIKMKINRSSVFQNWWTRSPSSSISTLVVDDLGSIYDYGKLINDQSIYVRPAMWINLE